MPRVKLFEITGDWDSCDDSYRTGLGNLTDWEEITQGEYMELKQWVQKKNQLLPYNKSKMVLVLELPTDKLIKSSIENYQKLMEEDKLKAEKRKKAAEKRAKTKAKRDRDKRQEEYEKLKEEFEPSSN